MTHSELKEFLDEKVELYNKPNFIESDPIQIPHLYSAKEDIEIAGFLASTIAWGNRKMIINNAKKMMDFMGNSPYDFVMSHSESQLEPLESFVHRTFNGTDFITLSKVCNTFIKITTAWKLSSQNISKKIQCKMRFRNLRNCFLKWSIYLELKNTFPIRLRIRPVSELICGCGGIAEPITKELILAFGRPFHLLNYLVRLMFILEM